MACRAVEAAVSAAKGEVIRRMQVARLHYGCYFGAREARIFLKQGLPFCSALVNAPI